MKKGFTLLLTAILMLTGCGSSAASTGTSAPVETSKETVKESQTEAASTVSSGGAQTEAASTASSRGAQTEAAGTESAGAAQTEAAENAADTETKNASDTLVIYFSRTGEQYVVGVIEKGNTAVAAAVFGGGRSNWHLQQKCSLKKTNGVWKITRSVAGTY